MRNRQKEISTSENPQSNFFVVYLCEEPSEKQPKPLEIPSQLLIHDDGQTTISLHVLDPNMANIFIRDGSSQVLHRWNPQAKTPEDRFTKKIVPPYNNRGKQVIIENDAGEVSLNPRRTILYSSQRGLIVKTIL